MPLFEVEVSVDVRLTRTLKIGAPDIIEAGKMAFDKNKLDLDNDGCAEPDLMLDIIGGPWIMADYKVMKDTNAVTGKVRRVER